MRSFPSDTSHTWLRDKEGLVGVLMHMVPIEKASFTFSPFAQKKNMHLKLISSRVSITDVAQNLNEIFKMSIKYNCKMMFSVFTGFFLLQGLHSLSLLWIKGNVVVYWELCWTGKALITGSTYDRFLGGDAPWFYRRTVDPKPQNDRLNIWQVMWCSRPPLVAPATSCPKELVSTDNGIAITIYTLATCAEYSVMCKCKIAVLQYTVCLFWMV